MTFLVCYGEKVVELHKSGLEKEAAELEANKLMGQGYKNVRVRMEDPHHPTWPLNFDLQEAK
jgi:hypothetical protein